MPEELEQVDHFHLVGGRRCSQSDGEREVAAPIRNLISPAVLLDSREGVWAAPGGFFTPRRVCAKLSQQFALERRPQWLSSSGVW